MRKRQQSIERALALAGHLRARAGVPPADWGRWLEGVFPCSAEGCSGWLDSEVADVASIAHLHRCPCSCFRESLAPLISLRLLDIPAISIGDWGRFLVRSQLSAWQQVEKVEVLTVQVWGLLLRQFLRRNLPVDTRPVPQTKSQMRSTEILTSLELLQSLFISEDMVFFPGQFLRRRYFVETRTAGEVFHWASPGRLAIVVLDAFLGKNPWEPLSTEVSALERFIEDIARQGAALMVFSSAPLLDSRRCDRIAFEPDYSRKRSFHLQRDSERNSSGGAAVPARSSLVRLLRPGAFDRLVEALAAGQTWLDRRPFDISGSSR